MAPMYLLRRLGFYCLILMILYFTIWHIIFTRTTPRQDTKRHAYVLTKSPSNVLCHPPRNQPFRPDRLKKLVVPTMENMSAYVNEHDASKWAYLPRNYSTLAEFIQICYTALMSRRLLPNSHSIPLIFRNPPLKDMIKPSCDGLWMEFGVFRGATITQTAKWKKLFCGPNSTPVYGFDTFSGLPTDWRPGYGHGAFSIANETMISVPSNVVLVKGLFIDTLPTQLRLIDREYQCHTPVSYVHIDCDIYHGARDVLFLLGSRLVTGSLLIFDELFNYPGYEKHEIKALFEFLAGSNLRLIPLGSSSTIDLNTTYDKYTQSFAFIVDLEEG